MFATATDNCRIKTDPVYLRLSKKNINLAQTEPQILSQIAALSEILRPLSRSVIYSSIALFTGRWRTVYY